ncbi:MAG: hypothetical protein M3O15_05035 [Acidobacteriota bacterium]|nr:hypothetical protein [Acidobacteriota bacterium]
MDQERGSEKLKRLHGQKRQLDVAALSHLGEIVDREKIEIIDWWWFGQPAIDRILGTLRVSPGSAGAVIDHLVKDEALRWSFEVFPYGIPSIDEVIIKIGHGPGGPGPGPISRF